MAVVQGAVVDPGSVLGLKPAVEVLAAALVVVVQVVVAAAASAVGLVVVVQVEQLVED